MVARSILWLKEIKKPDLGNEAHAVIQRAWILALSTDLHEVKQMTLRTILAIPSCLMLALPWPVAQAQPPAGRLLASQCAQCHGTNGKAVGDMESLAGESAREIYEELLEMKNSAKTNDIMHRQAKGYNENQLWLISQYYASLPGSHSDGDESEQQRERTRDDDREDD